PARVDLLADVTVSGTGTSGNVWGRVGTFRQQGSDSFTVAATPGIETDGYATANGEIAVVIDPFRWFDDLPSDAIGIELAFDYAASVPNGQLHSPADNSTSFYLGASVRQYTGADVVDERIVVLADDFLDDSASRDRRSVQYDGGGTITMVATPDAPTVRFELEATCSATRGGNVFALVATGSCSSGTVTLTTLRVTATPVS
ncbi:MAG: hypothetical protein AAGG08_03950, partial [Actinomycetota bacterium]